MIPIEERIKELKRLEEAVALKKESVRAELCHSLNAALKERGLTHRDAARITGISRGTISAMTSDRAINKPSIDSTLKIFNQIKEKGPKQ